MGKYFLKKVGGNLAIQQHRADVNNGSENGETTTLHTTTCTCSPKNITTKSPKIWSFSRENCKPKRKPRIYIGIKSITWH